MLTIPFLLVVKVKEQLHAINSGSRVAGRNRRLGRCCGRRPSRRQMAHRARPGRCQRRRREDRVSKSPPTGRSVRPSAATESSASPALRATACASDRWRRRGWLARRRSTGWRRRIWPRSTPFARIGSKGRGSRLWTKRGAGHCARALQIRSGRAADPGGPMWRRRYDARLTLRRAGTGSGRCGYRCAPAPAIRRGGRAPRSGRDP